MHPVQVWPTLFKKNSDGKSFQQWTVFVVDDRDGVSIQKEYGQVGGKLQVTEPTYVVGKNIGQKNETTNREQAIKEAEAQWTKKQTGAKGYTTSMAEAEAGVVSELNSGGPAPMLAKTYGKMSNDVFEPKDNGKTTFPCFGQPKLNGRRLLVTLDNGVATLTSRDCKPIETVPSLQAAIEAAFPGETLVLDGEMYNHEFYENLEELSHWVAHDDPRVQYHIYDLVDPHLMQTERFSKLITLFGMRPFESDRVQLVMSYPVLNHEMALDLFKMLRDQQYEGLILRNLGAKYELGKRSYSLQKLKGWTDREFLIVDVIEKGRGKDAGKAKFVCVTGDGDPIPGVEFKVDIAASQEIRAQLWEERGECSGKWLTVRFSYYTVEGKPFHAQGQEIRDESQANL